MMKVYNVKLRRWEDSDFELEPELSETYIELMRRVDHYNECYIAYKIRLLQDGSIDVFEPVFVEWFRFTGMPPPPSNGFNWNPVAVPKPSADNPVIHVHEGAG